MGRSCGTEVLVLQLGACPSNPSYEAKELLADERRKGRKNRRRIRWNTLRIFSCRERSRCWQIIYRSRRALLGQTPNRRSLHPELLHPAAQRARRDSQASRRTIRTSNSPICQCEGLQNMPALEFFEIRWWLGRNG